MPLTPPPAPRPRPRQRPGPGDAVLDLPDLLGHMDVDRAVARQVRHRRQFVGRDGARPEIFSKGIKTPLPAVAGAPVKAVAPPVAVADAPLARGKGVYERVCAACHLPDGSGVAGVFPPLANSDFFQERPYEMAHIVLHGRSGELVVNGQHYNGVMPAQDLNDEDVAAVINYINVEMNKGKPVLNAEQVKAMRQIKQQ